MLSPSGRVARSAERGFDLTSSVNFVDSFPEGEAMKIRRKLSLPLGGKPRIRNARKKEW